MSWILGLIYCGLLWLIFAKLKLVRLSLPLAILAASVGPLLIVTLLLCAQYLHPYTSTARVFQEVVPVIPQLRQAGRVTEISVQPNVPVSKGDVLFNVDEIPYRNNVDRLTAALKEATQSETLATVSVEVAEATLERSNASLVFATQERDRNVDLASKNAGTEQDLQLAVSRFAEAEAAVRQAQAGLSQAKLQIDVAKTKIEQVQTQLADAKYDLEQTTIVAPGDGYVTNMQLREGMLVGGGSAAVMSFVLDRSELTRGVVVASFDQKNFLRIKEGQYAEVALFGYPGQVFSGRVQNTIDITGAGQLTASGVLPSDLGSQAPAKFAVRIKLDKGDDLRLPGGSQAQVAVYTEDLQIAGIPVMFIIRTNSWLRYLQ